MKLDRLRWPEWLVGAAAVVLLGSMLLLSWYTLISASGPPGPQYFVKTTVDGWHGLRHAHWLVLATVVVALGLVFFQATRPAPAVPVTFSLFSAFLGGLTSIWLIYRVLISPPGGSAGFGAVLGLIAALAITYGGYASLRLEGIASRDAPQEIPTVRLGDKVGT